MGRIDRKAKLKKVKAKAYQRCNNEIVKLKGGICVLSALSTKLLLLVPVNVLLYAKLFIKS